MLELVRSNIVLVQIVFPQHIFSQQSFINPEQILILLFLSQYLSTMLRPLTEEDIENGALLILEHFQPNQPLTKTFSQNYKNNRLSYSQRKQLWTHWIQVSIQKRLIIGLFQQDSKSMIGLSICKDINYNLPQIEEEYTTTLTEEKCFIQLEELFISGIQEQAREKILGEGVTLETMIVVVHSLHQGKGLSQLLIKQSDRLAKQNGFKYCYCQASNFKTARGLIKSGYSKLFEIDLHDFAVDGVRPFYNISEFDRFPSSWLKKI